MPEYNLRLLALDGDGVRSLSVLQFVKQLMNNIDPGSSPKPCDYSNMIGGTSTGECVVIALSIALLTRSTGLERPCWVGCE